MTRSIIIVIVNVYSHCLEISRLASQTATLLNLIKCSCYPAPVAAVQPVSFLGEQIRLAAVNVSVRARTTALLHCVMPPCPAVFVRQWLYHFYNAALRLVVVTATGLVAGARLRLYCVAALCR